LPLLVKHVQVQQQKLTFH